MISIVKNIDDAKFVTHSGKFHADEIFGTILLEKIYGDVNLIRLPELDGMLSEEKIAFDIGRGKFDHHQIGGNGQRENGIKYAAFGLLWKEFGKEVLYKMNAEDVETCYNLFDKNFVQFIDAFDNGQIELDKIDIKVVTVSDIIEGMNPSWDEDIDSDIKFKEALEIAKVIFDNKLKSTISKSKAKKHVEEAIKNSENGIVILNQYMPYQEFILESKNIKSKDILYVVFKSNRGGYNVRAVAKAVGSFDCRKPLPESWAGLRNEDLQKVTGVASATFCHNARFICVADTLEDAIKLANLAVEN